jgi:serine/threonine protein kinase
VFRARDLETGKIVALKKVRFDNFEPESVRFMAREIQILRRLDHPNVMKLEGLITSRLSCSLYLVFEYMEHDLAGLCSSPDIKFTEAQVCSATFVAFRHQLNFEATQCWPDLFLWLSPIAAQVLHEPVTVRTGALSFTPCGSS